MNLDASALSRLPPRRWDVCVVGAGPAGVALAQALGRGSLHVCVIESGGTGKSARGDALRAVESDGIHVRDDSRERILGGASTTWSGLSSPLDPIDFATRPWVPLSGWPISRDDLTPYYRAASSVFRFPDFDDFGDRAWLPDASGFIPEWRDLDEKVFLAADPPQNFGRDFRTVLESPGVDLILGATVTQLEGDAGRVSGARLAIASGQSLVVHADVVVLCCGGIENARLLLNSSFAGANGLGNDRDQVGRCFMNHPKAYHGEIELDRPAPPLPGYFGFLAPGTGYAGYVGLRLKEAAQAQDGLLNSYVRFEPTFEWTDNPGVETAVHYLKRVKSLMAAFRRSHKDEFVELRSYAETGDDSSVSGQNVQLRDHVRMLMDLGRNLPVVARYGWSRLSRRQRPIIRRIRLRNFIEMAPDPANRVTLASERDSLGMRLPRVSHRCGELDRRSIVALHRTLAHEVRQAGWGRLTTTLSEDLDPWPIAADASHHMGATRMGTDPATSVVNADCRVHSVPNVYVAGASVFPTSGCANPTYTLVALALRLGEHLTRTMKASA